MNFNARDIYVVDDNALLPEKWYVVVRVQNGEKSKFVYVRDIKEKGISEESIKGFKSYQFSGWDTTSYWEHLDFLDLPEEEVELDALIKLDEMINNGKETGLSEAEKILGKNLGFYLTQLKQNRCKVDDSHKNGL